MSEFKLGLFVPITNDVQLEGADMMATGLLEYRRRGGLALAEAVDHKMTDESPCLPEAAVKSTDEYVKATIKLGHLILLHAEDTSRALGYRTLEPGFFENYSITEMTHGHDNPRSVAWEHTIEGYGWHRVHEINVDQPSGQEQPESPANKVLLLMPWQQPWRKGGAPYPAMYTVGNVAVEVQRQIATDLMLGLNESN